jgi:hypothetical protein
VVAAGLAATFGTAVGVLATMAYAAVFIATWLAWGLAATAPLAPGISGALLLVAGGVDFEYRRPAAPWLFGAGWALSAIGLWHAVA